jgi:hypothetical protein
MGVLNYQVTGTAYPPYMYPNGYRFPGSRFSNTIAGNRPPEDALEYAFDMLVGKRGILMYSPVLLIGFAGLLATVIQRGSQLRQAGLIFLAGMTVLVGYLATQTFNFGGVIRRALAYRRHSMAHVLHPSAVPSGCRGPKQHLPRHCSCSSPRVFFFSAGSAVQVQCTPGTTAPPVYVAHAQDDDGERQFELVVSWQP